MDSIRHFREILLGGWQFWLMSGVIIAFSHAAPPETFRKMSGYQCLKLAYYILSTFNNCSVVVLLFKQPLVQTVFVLIQNVIIHQGNQSVCFNSQAKKSDFDRKYVFFKHLVLFFWIKIFFICKWWKTSIDNNVNICVSDHRVADRRWAIEAGTERSVPAGLHKQHTQQEADAAHRHTPGSDQEPTAAAGCEWTHVTY